MVSATAIPANAGSGKDQYLQLQLQYLDVLTWRVSLPVASTLRVSTNGPNNRSKLNINALELVLGTHIDTLLSHNPTVPRRGNRHTSGKGARVVGESNTKRRVLETECLEAKSGDRSDISNALLSLPTYTSGDCIEKLAGPLFHSTADLSASFVSIHLRLTFSSNVN